MKFTETALPGVYIVEPQVFGDNRGFFMESWSSRGFEAAGLHYDFVQDNHSLSTVKGTLRGIHGPAANLMKAPSRCAVALETALGAGMQNIVVDREEDAKAAISLLKQRNGGRATFLPLTAIRGEELREQGVEIYEVLQRNDAYHALQKVGGLVITGGTGTNVNDVSVALLKR